MNAPDKFFARDAHVDEAAVKPLPNSRKIYVEGSRADVRVPMREIAQSDTPASFGLEKNPPLVVYDTSGPYTDPEAKIDIRSGLAPLRAPWIEERGDTVAFVRALVGVRPRAACRHRAHRDALRPASQATPRQAGMQRIANALRAARHRHAGDGVHRHPREPQARGSAADIA